jgi:catechol 2,3-dioxygenase-like lactoylglutathione lyase family enzyme
VRLAQVNVFVADFPRMLGFYRDVLGLEVVPIEPGPPCIPLVNWVSLAAGRMTLELFDADVFWDRELLRAPNRDALQLCFLVDDVERERDRLTGHRVTCDPVVEEGWGRYSSFTDPEGNRLQLFELTAGTFDD